jgi:inorganic triphosphatase YgiF
MVDRSDGLEIELKFIAGDEEPLIVLETAARLGPADLGPRARFDETDRYLDTAGLAMAAAGWACRLRLREDRWIVSLKGPPAGVSGDGAALHRRPEVEAPAVDSTDPDRWPPSEARSLVAGWAGGNPLIEQVRLDQRRTERRVQEKGQRLGLLSLDRVTVLHRGDWLGSMAIVELELERAGTDRQATLAAALAGIGGLRPDRRTKLQRALEMVKAAGRPARSG